MQQSAGNILTLLCAVMACPSVPALLRNSGMILARLHFPFSRKYHCQHGSFFGNKNVPFLPKCLFLNNRFLLDIIFVVLGCFPAKLFCKLTLYLSGEHTLRHQKWPFWRISPMLLKGKEQTRLCSHRFALQPIQLRASQ